MMRAHISETLENPTRAEECLRFADKAKNHLEARGGNQNYLER